MALKSETIITIIALFIIAILTITAALLFAYPYTDINGTVYPNNNTALILTGIAAAVALLGIVIYLIFIGIKRDSGWRSWHDLVTFVSLIVIAVLCIIVIVNPDNVNLAKILLWISFGLSLLALLVVIIIDITIVREPPITPYAMVETTSVLTPKQPVPPLPCTSQGCYTPVQQVTTTYPPASVQPRQVTTTTYPAVPANPRQVTTTTYPAVPANPRQVTTTTYPVVPTNTRLATNYPAVATTVQPQQFTTTNVQPINGFGQL